MHRKIFNIRTGIIVLFTVLLISYGVLAVLYITSLYQVVQPSPDPSVDVVKQDIQDDGSTIKVPDEVTVGVPFTYSLSGNKLVDAPATVTYQLECKVGQATRITPLNSYYSNAPKGRFDVSLVYTIPTTLGLTNSDSCIYGSTANYTFYTVDKNGVERSFIVTEQAKSKQFKLIVPAINN